MVKARNLILILGDQLTPTISSLRDQDPQRDVVVMGEVIEEATYVGHHKKKLIFVFSSMRAFADELRTSGWRVEYARLDAGNTFDSFDALLNDACARLDPQRIIVTEPGEWRLLTAFRARVAAAPLEIREDDRFVCSHAEFKAWARGRRSLLMESFYRDMRRKTGLLMEGSEPAGGRWNFDQDNRKPPDATLAPPVPFAQAPGAGVREVIDLVAERFAGNFGDAEPFFFATDRAGAEAALERFIALSLPRFGDYQDAMVEAEAFLHHSVLALYINCGLLDPLAVCKRAEDAWRAGEAPINAVEGFIRQIIGWREYVRGVYWLEGPDYVRRNALDARRPLPAFYWSGETRMACMRTTIEATRRNAYAHHIQRLMVTGAFALLAGIDPYDVHEWYLAVYADAYEWVEAPNVIGMALYADGGVLATKPYAASGAYINRMSDSCKRCAYKVTRKTGEGACPFNALYWDFLARNRAALGRVGRLAQAYNTWDRLGPEKQGAYRDSARAFLDRLDAGAPV